MPIMRHAGEVAVRQPIHHGRLNRPLHRAPRTPEQRRDLLPRQDPCPRRDRHQQRAREPLLAHRPGQRLHVHARTPGTLDAPGRIDQRHRDLPQGHMAKVPGPPRVPIPAPRAALATPWRPPPVWSQLGHQAGDVPRHAQHPKPLQFHRRLDQTFHEHESPLRYPGSVATPKYLMRLMFFNPKPFSACIHLYEEPKVQCPQNRSLAIQAKSGDLTR